MQTVKPVHLMLALNVIQTITYMRMKPAISNVNKLMDNMMQVLVKFCTAKVINENKLRKILFFFFFNQFLLIYQFSM